MAGFYATHIAPRLIHLACGCPMIAQERSRIVPEAEGVVLEIGMGSGLNLPHYDRARVRKVVGVEPSVQMTKLAGESLAATGLNVEVIEGVAEDLPLETASADTAVITYTLCSVADPERALGEVRRVLKPSGRILVLEHGRSDRPQTAKWQDRLNPLWRPLAGGCNINRATAALVTKAGFAFDRVETFRLRGTPEVLGFHTRGVARPR